MPDISCQTTKSYRCLFCVVCKKVLKPNYSNVHIKCTGLRKKKTKKVALVDDVDTQEIVLAFQ